MTRVPLLSAEGLVSGYGGAMVLHGVSFSLAEGEILAILGKNGMGKSTLLKTIMGFVAAREGAISFAGQDSTGRSPHLMARDGIAYAPQEFTIFQDLTVEENLRLGFVSWAELLCHIPREHTQPLLRLLIRPRLTEPVLVPMKDDLLPSSQV